MAIAQQPLDGIDGYVNQNAATNPYANQNPDSNAVAGQAGSLDPNSIINSVTQQSGTGSTPDSSGGSNPFADLISNTGNYAATPQEPTPIATTPPPGAVPPAPVPAPAPLAAPATAAPFDGVPQYVTQGLAQTYASGQAFTPDQQAVLDQLNPKPPNTEDPEIAAQWYRGFSFLNPLFSNITADDVTNQRMLAVSGALTGDMTKFDKWYLAGKPGGQYNEPPPASAPAAPVAPAVPVTPPLTTPDAPVQPTPPPPLGAAPDPSTQPVAPVAPAPIGRPRAVSPVAPAAPDPATPQSAAPAFTGDQLSAVYKSGQVFTPEQQAALDQLNPKPPNTEDPEIAAQWYRGFSFLDPRFANITAAEVTNQRMLAVSGVLTGDMTKFDKWYLAGMPGGQYNDPTPTPTPTPTPAVPATPAAPPPPTVPPVSSQPVTPQSVPPSSGVPVAPTAPPVAPPVSPAAPAKPDPNLEALKNAMRAQATHGLVDAERQLRARAALHNTQDTGAFDSSLDTMWRDATVNENTQLSQLDYDAFQKQADRALQEALAKIDSGDKRYATDSSLTASKYSADTGLQAAQFGANASAGSAAANAAAQLQAAQIAAGAQKYGDDARYNAALAQTDVDREKNYLGFTSSQQQSILDYLKAMFGSSADNLIGSLPFPTGTIVTSKP